MVHKKNFLKKLTFGRTYISQYMNMKLDEPPKPRILKKLANASNGITTYKELLDICGYSEKTLESEVFIIYNKLKEYHKYINNGTSNKDNFYQIEGFIEDFQTYIDYLDENLTSSTNVTINLDDIFNLSTVLEDYQYIGGFLLIYNEFLKLLEREGFIDIIDNSSIDCFDIEDIYNNLDNFKHLKLLSTGNENFILNSRQDKNAHLIKYINSFSRCLSLACISEFDSNALTELFKKKANNQQVTEIRTREAQDPLGLARVGFNIKDYNPPTDKQRKQLAELIKVILKDNKKNKEDDSDK